MKQKILIAGSRYFTDYDVAKAYIDHCLSNMEDTSSFILLSGGCRGADRLGERYAEEHGWEIRHFLPDWERYGRSAGPRRNQAMVEEADYVICFWDGGRGTKSTITYAERLQKPLRIKRLPPPSNTP